MVIQSWASVTASDFSVPDLVASAVSFCSSEEDRVVLKEALPIAWAKLDDASDSDWYAYTGLGGDAFDAIDKALDIGLPHGDRSRLQEYSIGPAAFPALLFLALIVGRLPGRRFDPECPHQAVRSQLWHMEGLVVAIMRNLPSSFDLKVLPEMLWLLLPPDDYLGGLESGMGASAAFIGEAPVNYGGSSSAVTEDPAVKESTTRSNG